MYANLPKRIYIKAEEKGLPGHKPMKDRITVLFCANACGDLKIIPLLVKEHSQKLTTEELPQLHEQQRISSGKEKDEEPRVQQPSSAIKAMLKSLESISSYFEKYIPDNAVAIRSKHLFNLFQGYPQKETEIDIYGYVRWEALVWV